MKLLGRIKNVVDQDKDREDVPKSESPEDFLAHCNLVNNIYQQVSKALFTFIPNKTFGQLITIASHSLTILNATNFHPLKYGLLIKIVNLLKLKIMLI